MKEDANSRERRIRVLDALGADQNVRGELLTYNENHFDHTRIDRRFEFPLPDEPHVEFWQQCAEDAVTDGVVPVLQRSLVQLRFPVREGISETDEYRSATRRGVAPESMESATGLTLLGPESIELRLHPTPAGTIPILIAGERADFVALIQALTRRNEPVSIPDSMGALMVAGYNNWGRVNALKRSWQQKHPEDFSGAGWSREFSENVIPDRTLYQDKFIILSSGPYSGVAARDLGLTDDEWRHMSLSIRLEHECTHYFTRRLFGSMQNKLLDELIADYRGIVAANGRFRADWFLRFLGLEDFPRYRAGGRLEVYRGEPPLSEAAFRTLQELTQRAAENLERIDHHYSDQLTTPVAQAQFVTALIGMTMEELADSEAAGLVDLELNRLRDDEEPA